MQDFDSEKPFLVPPFRYASVTESIFRGTWPKERNYEFLKRLKLKTLISLLPEPPNESLLKFCAENGIQNLHFKVGNMKNTIPVTSDTVTKVLQILVQQAAQPVYVHCMDGNAATGIVIMCLRKLQMWDPTCTLMEYARFARDAEYPSTEPNRFLETFQTDLDLPPVNLQPSWLKIISASNHRKHATVKVKLKEQL